MDRVNIVPRNQFGKLMVGYVEKTYSYNYVPFHLETVSSIFNDGTLDEDLVDKIDGTHFISYCDNVKTLCFVGTE